MTGGVLEVEGLSKTYGAVVAADDLSLAFEHGECHGIIGPNGSGKTTLFDLMSGFERPDDGVVRFRGEDVTGATPDSLARRGLVRTFQIVAPFDGLTVRENLHSVYEGGRLGKLRVPAAMADRAEAVLERLDIAHVADHRADELSGGQQKLLELARALMLDPDCLLLDEPTAGVNPGIQNRVLDAIRKLTTEGTTVVVIEHDMRVIADLADRITVLHRGGVLSQGDFSTVADDPAVRRAYIGREDAADGPAPAANGSSEGVAGSGTVESAGEATPVDAGVGAAFTAAGGSGSRGGQRLVARDLVAGYGAQVVLDGVTVRSHDGVTCVFGPNGSGKSTLLKAIAGVVPVRSGSVRYGDRRLTDADPRAVVQSGITTVPQNDRVFRRLTVRENLQLGLATVTDDETAAERFETVLEVFPDLEDSLSEPASSLSGGQMVMLGLARAMLTGASLYLLDEPFSGLAPSKVADVRAVIEDLVDRGAQVVLVEQQVQEALAVADHVYVLARGELQFDGTPADLRDSDAIVDLYLDVE